jgi:hypothetical protein
MKSENKFEQVRKAIIYGEKSRGSINRKCLFYSLGLELRYTTVGALPSGWLF